MITLTNVLVVTLQFKRKPIRVPYQGEDHEFDVWARPLWDWCVDLLTKHQLSHKMHWDAERNFKFDGEKYERFYDEPWTADAWWEKQVCIPFSSIEA